MKTYTGNKLQFISRINRDGKGVVDAKEIALNYLDEEIFKLHALSLTHKTYIAVGFNFIYIVKIK